MRAYFQLVRAPNLFTAASNAVTGFVLMTAVDQAQFDRPRWDRMLVLMFISAALYASGAVFNDCLDFQHDNRFRPERPIPSGQVPLGRAYALGVLLVLAALAAAMCLRTTTVLFTGLLITAIWLYNGVLKRFMILGALGMGLCRFLNVMLGMSTGSSLDSFMVPENRELIWAPLLMGLYATIITAASHYEDRPAGGHGPWVLFGAAAGLPIVLSGAAFKVVETLSGWLLLGLLIPATAAIFIMTLMKVTFASVRKAIAASVLLIIVFDAAVILGTRSAPTWLGLAVLLTVVPAGLMARVLSPS